MDFFSRPCSSRTRRRTLLYKPITRQKTAHNLPRVYSSIVPDDGLPLLDECSFRDLQERTEGSLQQLALQVATEKRNWDLKRQETNWRKGREELSELSTCIATLKEKLGQFWSSAAEFSKGRTRCQGRYFGRRSSYLKQYLELVLDFRPSSYYLGPGGKLDHALRGAQQFLSKSRLWSSDRSEPGSPSTPLPIVEDVFLAEYQKARSTLQELSAYGDRLDTELQDVSEQLQQLLSVEDALDNEQREREMEQQQSDKYMERLERFIREVIIRLQMFIVVLFLFCKLSGVSDNHQPMCITMPWNIRPALIVLWGVCWMFYPPQDYVDLNNIQGAGPEDNVGLARIDWPSSLSHEQMSSLPHLDPFPYQHDVIADQPTLLSATDLPAAFLMSGFAEQQAMNVDVLSQTGCEDRHGYRAALDPKDAFSNYNLPSNWGVALNFQTVDNWQPTIANGQSEFSEPAGTVPIAHIPHRSSSHETRSRSPSQQSNGLEQLQQPMPSNAEGYRTCKHAQCSNMMFNHPSDLKRHDDKTHNRQKCDMPGCTRSFGSKGDLFRHKQTKHNQISLHKLITCPEAQCKYSHTPHFKRKDNLVDHLKRIHNYSHSDAKAKADSGARSHNRLQSTLNADLQSTPLGAQPYRVIPASGIITGSHVENSLQRDQSHYGMPGPSKKRRLSRTVLHVDRMSDLSSESSEEYNHEAATWRRKAAQYKEKNEALQTEQESLKSQIRLLESKVQVLEKNQNSLIALLAAR